MRTISFSVLKSKLQDGSKRQTTRPAFDTKVLRKTGEIIEKPARFGVGDMARLYWKQRNYRFGCGDACVNFITKEDYDGGIREIDTNDCLLKLNPLAERLQCFSKIFRDVKITDVLGISINTINDFEIRLRYKIPLGDNSPLSPVEVSLPIFYKDRYLIDDGFDNPKNGEDFFLKIYPELKKMELPFWCYRW